MDNFEVVDFCTLSETVQTLIKEAVEIRKRAYVPYSQFAVGAAILTEDSKIFTGCNIENAALGPSICAERSAVPRAVCDGYLKFKMIAVVAHQEHSFTAPCGVCRQTLSEFCSKDSDIEVYLSKPAMDKVLSETVQHLIKQAAEIRKRAYCPYSNFAVGAALLTEEGAKVYTGCNIENAAYSPCICAERAAVPKAVCDGYLKLTTVAIVADQEDYTAPCGVCRQTLNEFCGSDGDMDVYLSKPTMDKILCTKLSDLLPLSFKLDTSITTKVASKQTSV